MFAQNEICEFTKNFLIFRHEDNPRPIARRNVPRWNDCLRRRRFARGQENSERRTLPDLARAGNLAAVLLHNRVDGRETQPRVLARLRRAEERLEQMLLVLLGQTKAGIRKRQKNVISCAEMDIVMK